MIISQKLPAFAETLARKAMRETLEDIFGLTPGQNDITDMLAGHERKLIRLLGQNMKQQTGI